MSAEVPAALAAVLDGRTPGGVLPWPAGRPVADALAAARDAGWHAAALDLTGAADKAAFMDRCAAALELPGYFGGNWDALADCLTDLSWWPPGRGRLLVVTGWQEYAAAAPEDWGVVEEVLADAVAYWRETATPLALIMAGGRGRQAV
ncbi:hypothetical protein ADL22_27870 [Streptomyces sp. NRRL F-4489]|uniref:barstar family protein n=1 Tax=Streptomyces sp. NRRL F-4489 TaxID=1609095 RepID=UPI00074A7AEC|nr:barstar family protein [Streptomyces sp. NRRL F-4489]KUL35138.1 hypothetical protein ADL22_27870 [Streptomyces sp. NRRL F-4489]